MGWLSSREWDTRSKLIKELTRDEETHKLVKHCTRGNILWTVWQRKDTRFIACCLMQKFSAYEWGYKDMDESCHPYYYTCPLGYLAITPVANQEWRNEVEKYHERKRLQS